MSILRYTPEALEDVETARDWYNEQRPGLGEEFLDEVDAVIDRICALPEADPRIDDSVHRALLSRFPFALFYDEELNVILAVAHVRRHPDAWRRR